MHYTEFLRDVHALLQPETYLEIGVRDGRTLALSRARSVGVDPAFAVDVELDGEVALVRTTSDEFFARPDPLRHTDGRRFDFTFIDGLHLVECALRDFLHAESVSASASLIVLDDVLPRTEREADRKPTGSAWTGDVFKILDVLERHRPDLVVIPVDTAPTGLLVVVGLDPGNQVLAERYDEIVASTVRPDPQEVPAVVLSRECALAPELVLKAPFWPVLRQLRGRGESAREAVVAAAAGFLGRPVDAAGTRTAVAGRDT